MLPQNMGREAVGIDLSLALGVGEQVDLAVRLLERLPDLIVLEPCSPAEDVLNMITYGVPERDRRLLPELSKLAVVAADNPSPMPDAIDALVACRELPDQRSRDRSDQRMVTITLAPDNKWPGFAGQE